MMSVWNHSQLLAEGPAGLLERPLADFAALLREPGEIGTEHAERIDYVLRHTVVRLLVRAAGEEELMGAHGDLRALVPVSREEELERWLPRWRALADVLEARLAVLRNRDMNAPKELLHGDRVLALVGSEPGLSQREIGRRLDFKPANLSRILGILEAHELIERRSVGREKQVHPGRLAEGLELAGSAEPQVKRGVSYFYRPLALAA